jgi:plasmid stabilization system protein ParE
VVRWTARARADLKALHDFVAQRSRENAKTVVREILRRADSLPQTPYVGRKVPELDDEHLREIPAYSWRILYQVEGAEIFVVTLVHKRRNLVPEEVRP